MLHIRNQLADAINKLNTLVCFSAAGLFGTVLSANAWTRYRCCLGGVEANFLSAAIAGEAAPLVSVAKSWTP